MSKAVDQFHRVSPEVFYTKSSFVSTDGQTVEMLKEAAALSPKSRARLCTHPDPTAKQQEMLIVMHRGSYVPPHRHLDKSETVTVLEGQATAILFSDTGEPIETIDLDEYRSKSAFFYRMPAGTFHSLLFRSEWFVFLETTIGPFNPDRSETASWAPPESQGDEGLSYLNNCAIRRSAGE